MKRLALLFGVVSSVKLSSTLATTSHARFLLILVMVSHDCIVELEGLFDRDQFSQRHILRNINVYDAIVVVLFRVLVVDPLQGFVVTILRHFPVVHDLAHLCIQKCVTNNHFFILNFFWKGLSFEREVVEVETQRSHASVAETLFELLKLLDEGASDF